MNDSGPHFFQAVHTIVFPTGSNFATPNASRDEEGTELGERGETGGRFSIKSSRHVHEGL